jgi:PAS domain-containing protein
MGDGTFQNIVQPMFDRCLTGETTDYGDWFYFMKAGNRFVSATYSPYFEVDGSITGVVISNRDVTARREAEISLQDSEERLRLALTAANQGLYDLNPQSGETVVSPEYATMLGYSPEELQETRARWID